jgi:hypothetical protein
MLTRCDQYASITRDQVVVNVENRKTVTTLCLLAMAKPERDRDD